MTYLRLGRNGVKTHRERWVIIGGAAFTLLFLVALYLLNGYHVRHPKPLLDAAWRGDTVRFTLHPQICETLALGELVCGKSYIARYAQLTNTWTVMGPTNRSTYLATTSFSDAPNEPGNISIWGVHGVFDNTGKLTIRGLDAGRVEFWQGTRRMR
jgi:hypothetical protein